MSLKSRLKKEVNKLVTNCDQLKLKAQDGKYRMTDVVDIEGMFRIIKSIRDNMDRLEVILTDLSEETTKRLAEKHRPQGLSQNKKVARMGGHVAKVAREDIEKNLGESVATKDNYLNYKYIEEKQVEIK